MSRGAGGLRIWLSFGLGALLFYAIDALLDGVPESIVLGIGVAVGGSVSIGFLVAVFVSNLPESLSATADLRRSRSPSWVYRLWASIAVASAPTQVNRPPGR